MGRLFLMNMRLWPIVCVAFAIVYGIYRRETCFVDSQSRHCCTIEGKKHCWPGLIVVGAKKAGSTLLSVYLSQHPDVHHAAEKELHFFSNPRERKSDASYLKRFAPTHGAKMNVECTPHYILNETALQRIAATPAKVVAILRHPTDRAYSEYWMMRQIEVQGEATLQWLHKYQLPITLCLGRVNGLPVRTPPMLEKNPIYNKYIENVMQARIEHPSDACLMAFPSRELQWNLIIHVRNLFRSYGPETYSCMIKHWDMERCKWTMPFNIPEFSTGQNKWTAASEYAPQLSALLLHHPTAHIMFYEDLVDDPVRAMDAVFEFAGLAPFHVTPRDKVETHQDIMRLFPNFTLNSGWNTVPRPKLAPDVREAADAFYTQTTRDVRAYVSVPETWP